MEDLMKKHEMTEEDIKLQFITPSIEGAGWDRQKQIRMEYNFTDGRVIVRGNVTARGKRKRTDYLLYYKPNIPLAIVEAKDMLSSLDAENGRMAVVLPHGVLFRGASEGKIRRQLVEMNLLDAVIGLPANLFYGTGIPACILVFKKNRTCRDILFIDASGDGNFEKGKNQNILRDSDITRIVNAYQARQNEDKYSYVASFDEIKENDFNLNIPRYVDTFEEEEPVDLVAVKAEIQKLDTETKAAIDKAESMMRLLGL